MNLQKTIKNLRHLSSQSRKEGYLGDATEYAFREHVLILLSKIAETHATEYAFREHVLILLSKIAETPKQKKYFWQTLENLKLIKDKEGDLEGEKK